MRKKKRDTMFPVICGLLMMGVITIAGWVYYKQTIEGSGLEDMKNMAIYEKHYVLIADSATSSFWKSVYDSAAEAGAEQGALVEFTGLDFSSDYSMEDLMRMSIAKSVDGIIVQYSGTAQMQSLIDEAVDKGIPVVTIADDAPQSKRQSFVGVSSYELGAAYSQQVISLMDKDTEHVMILTKNYSGEGGQKQLAVQITNAVLQNRQPGQAINVEVKKVSSQSTFDTEEAIRNVFQSVQGPPDILVCLDEVDAECAYYSVVDYNDVGMVSIVGYYSTPIILEGIEKGIIPVTVELDARQMGTSAIDALTEYQSEGRVSDYYSVDVNIITQENVKDYLEEDGEKS